MAPEEFGLSDMIRAIILLAVPFAAGLGVGGILMVLRKRDQRRK